MEGVCVRGWEGFVWVSAAGTGSLLVVEMGITSSLAGTVAVAAGSPNSLELWEIEATGLPI